MEESSAVTSGLDENEMIIIRTVEFRSHWWEALWWLYWGGGGGPSWTPIPGGPSVDTGGGGAPQSDGTSAEPPPPDDKTDCEQFVDKLVNAVENRKDHFAARASIGLHLADMAIGYLSIGKQRVTGFLERLTDDGQDNDVYRHVAGGAASVLLDGFGLGSGADSLRQDFNIWRGSRVKEAFASKEGNRAGERVGSIIAARIDGFIKTAEALRNKISAVLCNK